MEPIDVSRLYGDQFKIDRDEAAGHEVNGRRDPWLYLIPCRYGHIGPHSDRLLSVYCHSARLVPRLMALPGIVPKQVGETEAILAFPPELFDPVAQIVQPRRRRRLSESHRRILQEAGRGHRFRRENTVLSAREAAALRIPAGG